VYNLLAVVLIFYRCSTTESVVITSYITTLWSDCRFRNVYRLLLTQKYYLYIIISDNSITYMNQLSTSAKFIYLFI